MTDAVRDQNHVPVALGASSSDPAATLPFLIDPITGRLLVNSSSGSGDVVGPASSTDDAVVRFDGTTGKPIQNSTLLLGDTGPLYPGTNDGVALGDTTHNFSDLFLATGAVINYANGNVVITHTSGILTMGTGEMRITTPGTNAASVVTVGGSQSLTSKTYNGLTITTSSGTLTIANSKVVTVSNTLTFTGTDGSSVAFGAGGTVLYTTSAIPLTVGTTTIASGTNTRILYDNSGVLGEYTLTGSGTVVAMQTAPSFLTSITTPSVLASANDSGALGASGTAFADLFLASGGVINWNAGDVTITHSANALAFGGASSGYSFDAAILPSANDSAAIGAAATSWADLFLASGALINFANGNAIITHSSGIISVTTGELRITSANVGTNADSVPTLSSTSTMTNKTLTAPTLGGATSLADGATIKRIVPTVDGTATGPTTSAFVSGYTSSAVGDLVYLDSNGKWQKTDSDALSTTTGLLGIALAVAATDAALLVALPGSIVYATAFPTMTIGVPMYVGETAGAIQSAIPTGADNAVRVVGFAVHADKLYFLPSSDTSTTVA